MYSWVGEIMHLQLEQEPRVSDIVNPPAAGLHIITGIALSSWLLWSPIHIPVVSVNKVQLPGALLPTN